MNGKLVMMVALAGCVGETEPELHSQTKSALKSNVIACDAIEDRNAICQLGDIRFESQDLALTDCTPTRRGQHCVAPQILSPDLPPELWPIGSANGGVWKTTNFVLSCPDSQLACDGADPLHCWCDSSAAKGGNVEFEWKVEEGES